MGDYRRVTILSASFKRLEPCACIAIFGRRRTGKSHWAMYIALWLSRDIDRWVCFCGNRDNRIEWEKVLHPLYILGKDKERLKTIRDYQDKRVSRKRKKWIAAGNKYEDFVVPQHLRLGLVIDDCGSDRSFMHSNVLLDIATNGRHYGIDLVILCQYFHQLPTAVRDQLDYIGLLKTNNQKNIDKIFHAYVSEAICDKRTWSFLLSASTTKKGRMCWIDNQGDTLKNRIFHAKMEWPVKWRSILSDYVMRFGREHYLDMNDVEQYNDDASTTESEHSSTSVNESSDNSDDTTCRKRSRRHHHHRHHHRHRHRHRHRSRSSDNSNSDSSVLSLRHRLAPHVNKHNSILQGRTRFTDRLGRVYDIHTKTR